ncbi:uncharacterized protein LOC112270576 [Brachypodium distachyon]|uniref:F-box domain-containing protein n=1 Tax=Brachypodium distachyon TaxID=15368 RepID=A0A0Q3R472_BRADI|nr:uncharacterized protein LOC112270576 [Brachypodium distachyon]KQK08306.1 hypothetical protein BRADI_2g41078v3 [Brachypodium distachyon]|eukprot:XP_024314070.1 uncharacterized protein LOC112270576 [Brachypodium distachyon]
MDMEHPDMLEEILRHLPPRVLAAARCVCKAWRATVDHHRLLRVDLLPLSLDAVIYDVNHIAPPKLFARRSTTRYITSRLDYLDNRPGYAEFTGEMADYCNGLFLTLNGKVVNPATRQWASLPWIECGRCDKSNRYLVYDPTVSPHYEVFYIPRIPNDAACRAEWPPSTYVMQVFSSKTNCWRDKSFVREGDAAGTIADVKSHWRSDANMYYAAYWQRSLYVPSRHTNGGFILRINLSNDKYKVIMLPKRGKGLLERIGKSRKGVYCVLDVDGLSTYQIWFLSESRGVIDWVLNNEINFETAWRIYPSKDIDSGPWISQSLDQAELLLKNDVNLKVVCEYNAALSKDGFEWESNDGSVVTTMDCPKASNNYFLCLGFHPYKEIALFHNDYRSMTFAYYFNSSKVRYLGIMEHMYSDLEISFAYAPCWMMDLPGSN